MSQGKRQQLIVDGQLNRDGSRKRLCPLCRHELTESKYAETVGAGVALAEEVAVVSDIGDQE